MNSFNEKDVTPEMEAAFLASEKKREEKIKKEEAFKEKVVGKYEKIVGKERFPLFLEFLLSIEADVVEYENELNEIYSMNMLNRKYGKRLRSFLGEEASRKFKEVAPVLTELRPKRNTGGSTSVYTDRALLCMEFTGSYFKH